MAADLPISLQVHSNLEKEHKQVHVPQLHQFNPEFQGDTIHVTIYYHILPHILIPKKSPAAKVPMEILEAGSTNEGTTSGNLKYPLLELLAGHWIL